MTVNASGGHTAFELPYIVSDNQLKTSAILNFILGAASLLVFITLRGTLRSVGGVYQRRRELADLFLQPPQLLLGGLQQAWSWATTVLCMSDTDIVRTAGFDALLLNRTILMGLQIFSVLTLLALGILLPTYYSFDDVVTHRLHRGTNVAELSRTTISNLPPGHAILWLPTLATYLVTAYCCWVLLVHCQSYAELRMAYMLCLDAAGTQRYQQNCNAPHRRGTSPHGGGGGNRGDPSGSLHERDESFPAGSNFAAAAAASSASLQHLLPTDTAAAAAAVPPSPLPGSACQTVIGPGVSDGAAAATTVSSRTHSNTSHNRQPYGHQGPLAADVLGSSPGCGSLQAAAAAGLPVAVSVGPAAQRAAGLARVSYDAVPAAYGRGGGGDGQSAGTEAAALAGAGLRGAAAAGSPHAAGSHHFLVRRLRLVAPWLRHVVVSAADRAKRHKAADNLVAWVNPLRMLAKDREDWARQQLAADADPDPSLPPVPSGRPPVATAAHSGLRVASEDMLMALTGRADDVINLPHGAPWRASHGGGVGASSGGGGGAADWNESVCELAKSLGIFRGPNSGGEGEGEGRRRDVNATAKASGGCCLRGSGGDGSQGRSNDAAGGPCSGSLQEPELGELWSGSGSGSSGGGKGHGGPGTAAAAEADCELAQARVELAADSAQAAAATDAGGDYKTAAGPGSRGGGQDQGRASSRLKAAAAAAAGGGGAPASAVAVAAVRKSPGSAAATGGGVCSLHKSSHPPPVVVYRYWAPEEEQRCFCKDLRRQRQLCQASWRQAPCTPLGFDSVLNPVFDPLAACSAVGSASASGGGGCRRDAFQGVGGGSTQGRRATGGDGVHGGGGGGGSATQGYPATPREPVAAAVDGRLHMRAGDCGGGGGGGSWEAEEDGKEAAEGDGDGDRPCTGWQQQPLVVGRCNARLRQLLKVRHGGRSHLVNCHHYAVLVRDVVLRPVERFNLIGLPVLSSSVNGYCSYGDAGPGSGDTRDDDLEWGPASAVYCDRAGAGATGAAAAGAGPHSAAPSPPFHYQQHPQQKAFNGGTGWLGSYAYAADQRCRSRSSAGGRGRTGRGGGRRSCGSSPGSGDDGRGKQKGRREGREAGRRGSELGGEYTVAEGSSSFEGEGSVEDGSSREGNEGEHNPLLALAAGAGDDGSSSGGNCGGLARPPPWRRRRHRPLLQLASDLSLRDRAAIVVRELRNHHNGRDRDRDRDRHRHHHHTSGPAVTLESVITPTTAGPGGGAESAAAATTGTTAATATTVERCMLAAYGAGAVELSASACARRGTGGGGDRGSDGHGDGGDMAAGAGTEAEGATPGVLLGVVAGSCFRVRSSQQQGNTATPATAIGGCYTPGEGRTAAATAAAATAVAAPRATCSGAAPAPPPLMEVPYDDSEEAAAVAAYYIQLFPDSFQRLVPVCNHRAVDELLFQWTAAMKTLAAALQAAQAAVRSASTAAPRSGATAAAATSPASNAAAAPAGAAGPPGCGGAAASAAAAGHPLPAPLELPQPGSSHVVAIRRAAAAVRQLQDRVAVERARALHNPTRRAYFALFSSQRDAAAAAQCRPLAPPSRAQPLHFVACAAPPPDSVYWPALWTLPTGRAGRLLASLPLLAVLVFPIGVLTGALANLPVAVCGGTPELNALYWPWFCSRQQSHSLYARLAKSLLTGLLPALISLGWNAWVMPMLLYLLSAIQSRCVSLPAMDRQMSRWFFWWSLLNMFLGAVVGGGIFQQLGAYLQDPGRVLLRIGTALPTASNFFMHYTLTKGLYSNWLRVAWPHLGSMVGASLRGVAGAAMPRSWQDVFPIHSPPGYRFSSFYNGVFQTLMVGLAYVVTAPLIAPIALLFFLTAYITWRYAIVYIYERQYESGGQMFPVVFSHMTGYLLVSELFTGAVLLTNGAWIQATLLWCSLTPALLAFYRLCVRRYLRPLEHPPLSLAMASPPASVDSSVYLPPALREGSLGWYPESGKVWEQYGIPKYVI